MPSRLLLDLNDYVRIVNVSGKDIEGRYDGVDYLFPDAQDARDKGEQDYTDVHKSVAQHVFGFGLPDKADPPFADKTQCLFRLGWLHGNDSFADGIKRLKSAIQFHPVPQFPTSVAQLVPRAESVARVPSPTMGQGEAGGVPATSPASPADPFPKPKVAGK